MAKTKNIVLDERIRKEIDELTKGIKPIRSGEKAQGISFSPSEDMAKAEGYVYVKRPIFGTDQYRAITYITIGDKVYLPLHCRPLQEVGYVTNGVAYMYLESGRTTRLGKVVRKKK